MSNLDNLGDYNLARNAVKEHDGSWTKTVDDIISGPVASAKEDGVREGRREGGFLVFSIFVAGIFLYEGGKHLYYKYQENKQTKASTFSKKTEEAIKKAKEELLRARPISSKVCSDESQNGANGYSSMETEE